MAKRGRIWRGGLVGVLVLALAAPVPTWSAAAVLGTARGVRLVQLSLDEGKSWFPLGGRSFPVMEGTQLRSTTGGALLDLIDGSRINALPFSALRVRETGRAIEISLLHGRLTFRLPAATRVEIRTPAARLAPGREPVMAGEVFVGGDGTTGLKMAEGTLQVQEFAGTQRVLLASLEPVFLPKRPTGQGPLFSTDIPAAPPAGARGVFTPKGESIGYLRPDAQLVVHPGFTADLTQPFPARLVQVAMATIPEKTRQDSVPLFDVNGGYVGYLAGPVFYAQAQVAQAVEGAAPVGVASALPAVISGAVLLGAGAAIVAASAAAPPPATPLQPMR